MTKETEKPPVGLSVRGIYLHTCVKWFLYDRYVFQRGIVFLCYVGQWQFLWLAFVMTLDNFTQHH